MSEPSGANDKRAAWAASAIGVTFCLLIGVPVGVKFYRESRERQRDAEREAEYQASKAERAAEAEARKAAEAYASKFHLQQREPGERTMRKEQYGTSYYWLLKATDEPGQMMLHYWQSSKDPESKKTDRSSSVLLDMGTAADWLPMIQKAKEWKESSAAAKAPEFEKKIPGTVNVGALFRWGALSHSSWTNFNIRNPGNDGDQWINLFDDDLDPVITLLGETSVIVKEKLEAEQKAREFAEKLN